MIRFLAGWFFRLLGGAIFILGCLGLVGQITMMQREPAPPPVRNAFADPNDPVQRKLDQIDRDFQKSRGGVEEANRIANWVVIGIIAVVGMLVFGLGSWILEPPTPRLETSIPGVHRG